MTQTVSFDSSASDVPPQEDSAQEEVAKDEIPAVHVKKPEKFIPITLYALLDRLSTPDNWQADEYAHVLRFMRLLGLWRHQEYCTRLKRMTEAYLPFSPDRDTIRVTDYGPAEKAALQARLVRNLDELLVQGNYQEVSGDLLDEYFTATSPYALNLKVDLDEFEELQIYCRGASTVKKEFRSWKKLYLGTESFDVPIFQRLFLMLKLKPESVRINEIMVTREVDEKKARRILKGARKNLPDDVTSDYIYLKLFKNIPQSDLEMLFPNTRVEFKLLDKIKLGVTAGGGTVAGIAGTATKLLAAVATWNLFALIGGFVGIIALISRQVMKIFNQRTQYMMVLAQNLYFHSLADNHGVLTLMCDRAEEEDIKEELLLYAYLTQYDVPRDALSQAKQAIDAYLKEEFGVDIDYDIEDALSRLEKDGFVYEEDGHLKSLRPAIAAKRAETMWRNIADEDPQAVRA